MFYKLVAFDLDGTLLDDNKNISEDTLSALTALAEQGAVLVPATGRIVPGIEMYLEKLPFVRWCISVNGASVYDLQEKRIIHSADISLKSALAMCEYMDTVDALYDCYQNEWGYMTRSMFDKRAEYYADSPGILHLIELFRTPVDDLKEYLKEKGEPLQKLQLHFIDMEERRRQLELMPKLFPDFSVCTSLPGNIEINHRNATKGKALEALCRYLDIPLSQSVAFGDGTNDLDMLKTAGLGVAMANAAESVKEAADIITLSNNENGVAVVLRSILGEESGWMRK